MTFFFFAFSRARLRANSCARQLRVFCFPGSSPQHPGSLPECSRSLWEQKPSPLGAPRKWGRKRRNTIYLNSVTIVGFVGADPEQRQSHSNGTNFTVLSVATQRSWKNAQDEWCSKTEWNRVVAWNGLGERVAAALRKGDHVLVEGTLVSSSYDREHAKGKKATTVKHTVWQIRADSIRKLNRGQREPETIASGSAAAPSESQRAAAQDIPF